MRQGNNDIVFGPMSELGYFLLAVAILGVCLLNRSLSHTKQELTRTQICLAEEIQAHSQTQFQLEIKTDSLRICMKDSKIKKRCYELENLGIKPVLATILIIDEHTYSLDNRQLDLVTLLNKFKKEIMLAKANNCNLYFNVKSEIPSLSQQQYRIAKGKLSRHKSIEVIERY